MPTDWKDQVNSVFDFHMAQRLVKTNWSQKDTADLLNCSESYLSRMLLIYENLNHESVNNASSIDHAYNFIQKPKTKRRIHNLDLAEKTTSTILNKVDHVFTSNNSGDNTTYSASNDFLSGPETSASDSRNQPSGIKSSRPNHGDTPITNYQNDGSANPSSPGPVIQASISSWLSCYIGPKFDFIHANFENEKEPKELMSALDTIMSDSSYLFVWIKPDEFDFFNYTFPCYPFPLIWADTRNSRRFSTYHTALIGFSPKLKPRLLGPYCYSAPKRTNVPLPEPMLRHYFNLFINPTTRVLDLNSSYGAAIMAAQSLNAKSVLGIENDPLLVEIANKDILARRKMEQIRKKL